MALISFKEMLGRAKRGNYAVGYFEAWDQVSMEAILAAAEESRSPVIVGFGVSAVNQDWFNEGGLEYLAAIGRTAVGKSRIPLCFILNEISTMGQMRKGSKQGFNVVMMNSSGLSFRENLQITRKVVKIARPLGIGVEAELGTLPFGNKKDSDFVLTDPGEAEIFVNETGIDALAVSIGNVHVAGSNRIEIDLIRLERIHYLVDVPLVIHGGTGFPAGKIQDAIDLGVVKFNVGTILKRIYFEELRKKMFDLPERVNIQKIIGSRKKEDIFSHAKEKIKKIVKNYLVRYGSVDRA